MFHDQWFCGTPSCDVMTWNPRDTIEEFEAKAVGVELPDFTTDDQKSE